MTHLDLTYLAGLVAHFGVAFLSGSGLVRVTHAGLLDIAKFVAEMVANLWFGTQSDKCFLVGGP